MNGIVYVAGYGNGDKKTELIKSLGKLFDAEKKKSEQQELKPELLTEYIEQVEPAQKVEKSYSKKKGKPKKNWEKSFFYEK